MNKISAMPAAPSWLLDAVNELARFRSEQRPVALPPHAAARKVGRNQVWEIVATPVASKRYYAKFWDSPRMLERELRGREIVNRMANEHDWLLPAPVLFADPSIGVIVTEQIRGRNFQHLLAGSTRRFATAASRTACFRDAQQCLRLVFRFLRELHDFDWDDRESFSDYRSEAAIRRINRLASTVREHPLIRNHLPELQRFPIELKTVAPIDESESVVLYGDLSPGNVLFDGERIGLFDFEDFGFGPACRDYLWIEYLLEQFGKQWHYRNADPFLQMVRRESGKTTLRTLFRLEFMLMNLDLALKRMPKVPLHRRLLDRLEVRRVIEQLEQCFSEFAFPGQP